MGRAFMLFLTLMLVPLIYLGVIPALKTKAEDSPPGKPVTSFFIAMSTKEYREEPEIPPDAERPPVVEESEVLDLFPEWKADYKMPSTVADERIIESYLELLTLRQKIGQRFIAHIQGKERTERTRELIKDDFIAGIILYPWNVESPSQVKELTSWIQETSLENDPPVRLFICVDQEGGRVNAFKFKEMTRLSSPYYWGQYNDPAYVESIAYVVGREILELGCNMNFAPVLDVYGEPDTTIIGDRSMGSDPSTVGTYGIHYLKGAQRAGIVPVIKHFPGHGSTTIDSHMDLPIVEMTEAELFDRDLAPFRMAIEKGAEALMTSHVLYRLIDPEYPATLSVYILRKLLRDRLDFHGVVVSDGISMGALSKNFDLTETLRLSFKAGIDLILVHARYDVADMVGRVEELYTSGEITEEEIDEGVRRILRLKLKYGLLTEY